MKKYALIAVLTALLASCASTPRSTSEAPSAGVTPNSGTAPAAKPAAGTDLTGAWALNVDTPMGSREMKLNATQSGSTLTGTIASPRGDMPINGTVKGSEFEFAMKVNAQGMDMQVDYKGVVEGDAMKGTAKFGEFGEGTFTGKRQ